MPTRASRICICYDSLRHAPPTGMQCGVWMGPGWVWRCRAGHAPSSCPASVTDAEGIRARERGSGDNQQRRMKPAKAVDLGKGWEGRVWRGDRRLCAEDRPWGSCGTGGGSRVRMCVCVCGGAQSCFCFRLQPLISSHFSIYLSALDSSPPRLLYSYLHLLAPTCTYLYLSVNYMRCI